MKIITHEEDVKISSNWCKNSLFLQHNYPDSNINDKYEIANDMKKEWLANSFIKNFLKSYN